MMKVSSHEELWLYPKYFETNNFITHVQFRERGKNVAFTGVPFTLQLTLRHVTSLLI